MMRESGSLVEEFQEEEGAPQTVLVVDDDHLVRTMMLRIVELLGYNGIGVCDGAEAIELLDHRANEIHLVVTDYQMPIVDGHDLIMNLRQRNLSLPVVLVTGSEIDERIITLVSEGIPCLKKPISFDRLQDALLDQLRSTVGR